MKNQKVFVMGHKNPDTDSICSAIAYADIKNRTTQTKRYIPRRAGQINEETQYVLNRFGVQPPAYLGNIGTQVKDMDIRPKPDADRTMSLKNAWDMMQNKGIVTLPICNSEDELEGIVTIGDIADVYMDTKDSYLLSNARTQYNKIRDTLDGEIVEGNGHGYFTKGKILIGTADPEVMKNYIEENDMVIYNGDMVSQSKSEEQVFNSFMNKSIELFAQEKPMYYARGNHETRGVFATSFQNYFSVKEPHLYFTLRQGPAFFIFLDTGEDKPDSDIEYSGITDYDNYRTEQAKWLEQVIESDEFKQASYKIVIGHMPPVEWQGDIWHGPTEVLEKFIPILNKGKIDVMISGHYHINKPGYYYYEPSEKVHFPVLVNESVTALKGKIDRNSLKLQVVDKQKNILFEKTCLAK